MDAGAQAVMIERLIRKVRDHVDQISSHEAIEMDDAEVAVVAYGISARSARRAAHEARAKGIKAGVIKLNVAWPFPESFFRALAKNVKAMVMPEINMGQMVLELERAAAGACPVVPVTHAGGGIIRPGAIVAAIERALKELA